MIIQIPVVTITYDNGDGGYSIRAYNNNDELIADHNRNTKNEMTPELREEILSGEDEYENGYLGDAIIFVDLDLDTHKLKLVKPIRIHAGQ